MSNLYAQPIEGKKEKKRKEKKNGLL